ncbi:MAG: hypothetical protein KGL53_04845 [Elusimicrobia bacterium]|nr:hypothetical protein [Elusimicrobiota bacterium]
MEPNLISQYLRQTEILRAPRKALATFGATRIEYHMVSPVEELDNRTRLRQGTVVSLKPQILTPEAFAERFEGFGDDAKPFQQWLKGAYRDLLRSLEYNFKNQGFSTRVISEPPAAVAQRIAAELDAKDQQFDTLIRCPDGAWSLALMKFALDESARSFPVHVRDLERRGLFQPEKHAEDRRRREIEALFQTASQDRTALPELGKKLRDYGLFEEYEDRYLRFYAE